MAKFSLDALEESVFEYGLQGKKILIYGANSLGKTFQACKLDKPLLIMTESGGSAVKCLKTPCNSWSKFCEIVSDMTNEKNFAERYERVHTIVVDTAENLVDLSERATCAEFGVRDLSEINGRVNGYKISRNNFSLQINKLTSLGYCVVFIAHEERVTREDEVTGEEYTYIQPKGTSNEKSSMRMLRDLCDFTFYLRSNGINSETHKVIPSTAICVETKNVFARSRYEIQAFINPFTAEGLTKAIEDAVKKSAENEGADLAEYITKNESYSKADYFDLIKPYVAKLTPECGEEIQAIIYNELGEGRKISSATDDELVKLDNIYNQLVTKAMILGISI